MNFSKKTVLVIDNGLFIEIAVMLSKVFGRVMYYSPWEGPYPKSDDMMIGEGVLGLERVNDIWSVMDDVDLVVFPDVGFGPLQTHLERIGKRVWGSRNGERLELDRKFSKELCKDLGIDIGPYEVVQGIQALRAYLRKHENVFVKISRTRGDMETMHAKNYAFIEPVLDQLQNTFGAKADTVEFIVEEEIPDAVEIGFDGFTVDGKFSKNAMWGCEIKDKGFVMSATQYDKLPESLRSVNEKLSAWLKEQRYRGFFSTELRVVKGKAYLIDPCCRAGFPPSELYQIMISNWADIIWYGAEGTLVEPTFVAPWGAEMIGYSTWAGQHWQEIQFPEEIRNSVKLKNACVIGGRYYVVPQPAELFEPCAVVATGKSLDDAIKNVRAIAPQVSGYKLEFEDTLDKAHEEFDKGNSLKKIERPVSFNDALLREAIRQRVTV